MTRDELINLVRTYFAGVDGEDLEKIFSTFTEDCRFSVETHGVELRGRDAISGMFERLWSNHATVRHNNFRFIVDPTHGNISVQFRVTNTFDNGDQVYKSNCNFFTTRDGLFDTVAVYMAGENTLDRAE